MEENPQQLPPQQPTPIPGTQPVQALPVQSPPLQPSAHKMRKWFWAVGALLTAFALFFAPIPYYQNTTVCTMSFPSTCNVAGWHLGPSLFTKILAQQSNSQISAKPVVTQTPSPTPTPDLYTEASRSATANWRIYTTDAYTLRYPNETIVKETEKGYLQIFFYPPGKITGNTLGQFSIDSRLQWHFSDYAKALIYTQERFTNPVKNYLDPKTTVEEIPNGIQITSPTIDEKTIIRVILLKYKNGAITIEYTGNKEKLVIFDQIFSTFRFE